ncbi:MAG TPA: FCD domain-containing protein [Alphaproteobacteria bacterium]|nr:FCD domain-containing protein [Alphaproteobacteria bacterium]
MFQPIRPARLSDIIADQIRKLILEGTLEPGSRLPTERELAERFDTSRPTVREAVKKLEEEGLLRVQRGGMHIAGAAEEAIAEPLSAMLMADPQGAEDYMEFRQILEGSAAYLAALRANDIDREELSRAFDRMTALGDGASPDEEAAADADFHLAIYEASHNVTILHVMRALSTILRNDVLQNRRRLNTRQGYREITIRQHRAIYDAILAGAPEEAKQAAQAHIAFAREAIAEIRKADQRLEVSLRRISRQVRPIESLG